MQSLEKSDYYLAIENMSALYLRQKRYSEAIIFCNKYLTSRPYNFKLNYTLAISLYQTDTTDEALKYARISYQLYPDNKIKNLITLMEQGKELNLE